MRTEASIHTQTITGRPRVHHLSARDIMVTRLITLRTSMDMYEAIDHMARHRISGAPVVDGKHELVGVLSERDCISTLSRSLMENLPFPCVGDAMTREVRTVDEDTALLTVAHLFITNSFRRLPVVRGRALVGQISRRDLLQAMVRVLRCSSRYESALLYLSALDPGNAAGMR